MQSLIKKVGIASVLIACCSLSSAQQIYWCGVDKDTGQVNKHWCWTTQSNCEQGKPWQYVCVPMPKPN
jgi:hypothetical protein